MTRRRWVFVLAIYAGAGVLAYLFLGGAIPPCFGTAPTGAISAECSADWQASRAVLDRLFNTPLGGVAVFLALTVGTWVATRLARPRVPASPLSTGFER